MQNLGIFKIYHLQGLSFSITIYDFRFIIINEKSFKFPSVHFLMMVIQQKKLSGNFWKYSWEENLYSIAVYHTVSLIAILTFTDVNNTYTL